MEAELTTLDTTTVELEWLHELLMDLPMVEKLVLRILLNYDNQLFTHQLSFCIRIIAQVFVFVAKKKHKNKRELNPLKSTDPKIHLQNPNFHISPQQQP